MAVEELNGEVRFSTHLPYPNNLSRSAEIILTETFTYFIEVFVSCEDKLVSSWCCSIVINMERKIAQSMWTVVVANYPPWRSVLNVLTGVVQDAVGADGGAASADVKVGSSAQRRPSEPWNQETPLLWTPWADTEHEGEALEELVFIRALQSVICNDTQCSRIFQCFTFLILKLKRQEIQKLPPKLSLLLGFLLLISLKRR